MKCLCLALFSLFFCPVLHADNWPHWRGDGNGASATANPPIEWSDTKNVKWKVEIPGRGSGSPIVWEDKVFVVTAAEAGANAATKQIAQQDRSQRPRRGGGQGRRGRGGGRRGAAELKVLQFNLMCFNRDNGNLIWEKTAVHAKPHEGTHETNSFASASPCTDGKHVYAHFGSRGLYCYTMDGELKWKRDDLGRMQTRATFGEGSSPTIEGDMIILPWDHEGPSYIAAINKLTGDTIWNTPRDEPTCWATPVDR